VSSLYKIFIFLVLIISSLKAGISVPTLKLMASVRGDGMGSSCSALCNEIDGVYYNPATIKELKYNEIFTTYINKGEGIYCTYLSYGLPLDKNNSLGVSVGMFDGGNIEVNYFDGSSVIKNAQREYAIGLYYGREILRDLNAGVGLKFLYSTLAEDYRAYIVAFDFGIKYFMFEDIIIAISFMNVGPSVKYIDEFDTLPMGFNLGVSYPLKFSKEDVVNLATNCELNLTDNIKINTGIEYVYNNFISVRAGYKFNQYVGNITTGIGVRYQIENFGAVGLDYAYIYGSGWFDTHRVSLIFKF
jgi:hypothetical protein